MRRFFNPNMLARTYRDPVAWVILAVDLFPIIAVFMFGWGAVALVLLYWLENLIIGAVALARMTASSAATGLKGLGAMLFLAPFFTVHYGMFCFVHGQFVNLFAGISGQGSTDFFGPIGLIQNALASGEYMPLFVGAIIALQAFLFMRDFIWRGEYREANPAEEMMAPYARIFVLHIAIFAGAAALAFIGEPLWGVLALILARTVWGVFLTTRRRMRLDGDLPKQKVDGTSPI